MPHLCGPAFAGHPKQLEMLSASFLAPCVHAWLRRNLPFRGQQPQHLLPTTQIHPFFSSTKTSTPE